eukprot:1157779-Pelagomonas_calceolata.AAC.17
MGRLPSSTLACGFAASKARGHKKGGEMGRLPSSTPACGFATSKACGQRRARPVGISRVGLKLAIS